MKQKTRGSGVRHAFGYILILLGIVAVGYAALVLMHVGGKDPFGAGLADWFDSNYELSTACFKLMGIAEGVIGVGLFIVGWVFALTNNKPAKTAEQAETDQFADMIVAPQMPLDIAATEEAQLSAEAKKNRKQALANQKRNYKLAQKKPAYVAPVQEEPVATADDMSVPSEVDETIRYIPVQEAFVGIDMGAIQSVEDKFAEIAKMDKTQFVVYVARLFSMQGYQVKLTPVMDNKCIDMVVEKSGMYLAVGCVLTDRMLNANDLKGIAEGAKYYPVSNTIALTNTFFDAEAVQFAKDHRISLVDHDVLVSDFMVK